MNSSQALRIWLPRWTAGLVLAAAAALATAACGPLPGSSAGPTPGAAQSPWSPGVKHVVLEVDYAPGAEPYFGKLPKFGETWDLFETNAKKLVGARTLEAPHSTAQMQKLTDVPTSNLDDAAILAIAKKHQDRKGDSTTVVYYALWLNGYYVRDGQIQKGILGVHLGGTNVIAMFKPSIADLGSQPGPHVEKFVEQTTLIHELGHAIGLVNRGVPLKSQHEDASHRAHCTNSSCVMYFEVEGKAGAQELIKNKVSNSGSVIFGPECLADVAH